MDSRKETQRLLKRLRLLIQISETTQRGIEDRAGFSNGYLSQMLNGHVEIKLWHLLAVLDAIDLYPADLFFQLFPHRSSRVAEVLEAFQSGSKGLENPLTLELARLYGYGIESLENLEERLERCEDLLNELDAWGRPQMEESEESGLESSVHDLLRTRSRT